MQARLADYKVLTFDCYGTLIDWESGIWDALQPLLMRNSCEMITRSMALSSFAHFETLQESETPEMLYPELLAQVHVAMAEHLCLKSSKELAHDFGASVPHWPAFPDTADALRILKRHYKLAVLSNVNRAGFDASNRKLGVQFDVVYTAEEIGSYKPSSANFTYMLHQLSEDHGVEKADILHTAQSLHHDHVPARAHGLANAWIDRQRLSEGGEWGATAIVNEHPEYDFLYFSMMEMAEAVAHVNAR